MANRRVLVKRRKAVAQHPQDHADDAADRDGALPGRLQPARSPRVRTPRSWPSWSAILRAAPRTSSIRCSQSRNPAAPAALLVLTSYARAVRRLQRQRPAHRSGAPRRVAGAEPEPRAAGRRQEGHRLLPLPQAGDGRAVDRARRHPPLRRDRAARQRPDRGLPGGHGVVGPRRLHALLLGRPPAPGDRPAAAARPTPRPRATSERAARARDRVRVLARNRPSCSTSPAAGDRPHPAVPGLPRRRRRRADRAHGRHEGGHRRRRRHDQEADAPVQPRRQTQITMELLDIVGGANALA